MTKPSRVEWLTAEIAAQEKWIFEHGDGLYGYVQRYGSKDDEQFYGSGGEAIYNSDVDYLDNLKAQLVLEKSKMARRILKNAWHKK